MFTDWSEWKKVIVISIPLMIGTIILGETIRYALYVPILQKSLTESKVVIKDLENNKIRLETKLKQSEETMFKLIAFPEMTVKLHYVAGCESSLRPSVVNDNGKLGLDLNVFQVNEYHHGETAEEMNLDLRNLGDGIIFTVHLFETEGTDPWYPSQPCWDKLIKDFNLNYIFQEAKSGKYFYLKDKKKKNKKSKS